MKVCRWFHRWSPWVVEVEEMPDGMAGTWEFRQRRCLRKRCDMIEESSRCVSGSIRCAS